MSAEKRPTDKAASVPSPFMYPQKVGRCRKMLACPRANEKNNSRGQSLNCPQPRTEGYPHHAALSDLIYANWSTNIENVTIAERSALRNREPVALAHVTLLEESCNALETIYRLLA